MKNITTALLCLLFSFYSFGQCTHTFNMSDSYGDGWNGAAVNILVNGTAVVSGATITTGSSGSETFEASTDDVIELEWTSAGSWPSEISWTITDGEGTQISNGNTNTTDGGVAFCAAPESCIHTFNMADSYGDGWNGAAVDILVNGTTVLTGVTITTGSSGSETFEAATGDSIELVWTSVGSWPSEISWNISDGGGTQISNGDTNSTDGGIANCPPPPTDPTCTHTFNMADSYGDGWNGAAVNILVNGTTVVSGATITGGSAGTETFEASTGDTIELAWTSTGSWPSEISWTITDGEGTQIASGDTNTTDGGTAFCPPPPSCLHTFNMADSYGDGWNGAAVDILVNGTTVASGVTITGGSTGTETFEAATGDTIELVWTSVGSWPSEISWTITDGGGTQISNGNSSSTNGGTANCPDCIPPAELTVDNISSDSVTISWTSADDVTEWEYQLVPTGDTPSESGTATTDNPLTLNLLDSYTTYDLYIRSNCGGLFSSWSLITFTTNPACGDTVFDSGGASGNYSNNELVTITVYPENPGDLVTFTFLSFDTESCCDDLIVYDGPDTGSTVVGSFAGTAIPDPVTSTHSSGALTFVFDSDGSVTRAGYEILITCAPAPSCFAPTGLEISNISGTTADFNWNAMDGNASWEYVIVPTGDPAPTASGTYSAINSTTLTDLDFLTTYDVYVRAFCGDEDGYSEWSGPETFTTTQQTDYTIDCSLGQPVNIDYCYGNNDSTYWVFTSTDGYPLEVTFNSGNIEANWDDITIYDGPDNTGTVLFNNNTAGVNDLTGIVVESTSTSIYIEVDSDGSVSCQSSTSYTPWNFDVRCKTCITQTVEFDIVGSCEPVQEFYVEANITDMGDAMNLELTDNQGSAAQTTTSTGLITFGPYAANTQVVINVLNSDDNSCSVDSSNLTFLCPPPPNECSIVYAGEDTTFCSDNDPATVLTASYHLFGQDTTSYDVSAQENCPMPQLTGGTPTSLDIDDRWSEIIDLGFEFCFFGETYSQILIGSNGVLSFELENANSGNGWSLDADDTLPNSSNATLAEANIFGVSHDIDPSVCGDINYMILGSAPARQFVVNYSEVCHFGFSCNDNVSSSQIILYESSNTIDVNIFNKPVCTDWNDGLAAVGVQNIEGTVAFTPPGRNTGVWETSDEFWRFTPSIGEANYILEWYDEDNNIVGTDDTITVYPEETTTYTAAVTYNLCNGGTATVTDSVLVEITPTPIPVAVESDIYICEGEEVALEVNVDASQQSPYLVYYWTYDNVDIQFGEDNTFTFPAGSDQYGEYLVTAYNEETGCFADTTITVSPGFVPDLEDGTSFLKCANGDVELSVNILNDIDMTNDYNYAWYMNGELLQDGASPIFVHGEDLMSGTVTVEVTETMSMCSTETTIEVAYYMNQNCVDIPQGISPNGDGLNDCLVLDHLEDQEDIIKAEIYNRYGSKVFELNDYVDHWCGQDASSGNGNSGELLPVGTYFYVIQYASGKEPTISWIYLNY